MRDYLLQAKSLAGCLFMQGTKLARYFRLKGVFQVTKLKISACSTTSERRTGWVEAEYECCLHFVLVLKSWPTKEFWGWKERDKPLSNFMNIAVDLLSKCLLVSIVLQ